jgi:hypothetical protein
MMLVPAVLEADWDLLQDHSQVVEKQWEEPVTVNLLKQLMSVADLEHTVNEFLSTAYNETCAPHLKLSLK